MDKSIEAMKLALEALEMYGKRHRATYLLGGAWDEEITLGGKAITAIEETLQEHAMQEVQRLGQEIEQEPCDMGEVCLGCSPRSADGSCPDAKPSGACDCYKEGFRDGTNEFKECYEEQPPKPEQEPHSVQQAYAMAQVCLDLHEALGCKWGDNPYLTINQLKASPPQRKPLSAEQVSEICAEWTDENGNTGSFGRRQIARAIEAAHGIKE